LFDTENYNVIMTRTPEMQFKLLGIYQNSLPSAFAVYIHSGKM